MAVWHPRCLVKGAAGVFDGQIIRAENLNKIEPRDNGSSLVAARQFTEW